MNKIFLFATIVALSACSNSKTENAAGTDQENKADENTVSTEMIQNPATADNPTAAGDYAVVTFKTTEHNFGDILENQKVETTYEFTNTGKVDLLINDCRASCGCTVPEWPKTPIKPGASGSIKVVFDSAGKSGMNNKIVTVYANTKEGTIELKFSANVRAIKS